MVNKDGTRTVGAPSAKILRQLQLASGVTFVSENVGYIPNEIAIFHRDNDQQNHWV